MDPSSNPKAAVEAALFSSSEPVKIADISLKTGIPVEEVRTAVMDLRKDYDERGSALQVAKYDTGYRLTLRPEYNDCTGVFAKPELPAGAMRTLTSIAYYQPVLQSKMLELRGPRIYDDVRTLVDMGFVHKKKAGNTWELTTTTKFAQYFGFKSTNIKDIKAEIQAKSTNM